jgi:hypothetical protein
MITDEAINDRLGQISSIVSDLILPFNSGNETMFVGRNVQVFAGVEQVHLKENDAVAALIGFEMYLGDYQYKKNVYVPDIAEDYFEHSWKICLYEIATDIKKIFYYLLRTMLEDAMQMVINGE